MNRKEIPSTGRIGRYIKVVESSISETSFLKVVAESNKYANYSAVKKAEWWKRSVEILEAEVGTESAVEIMKTCGSKCCGAGQRKTAKKLMAESNSLKEFLEKFIDFGVKDGELGYEIVDDHTFRTHHNKCFCGQVKQMKQNLKTATYCQCSVEFNRQFFSSAFGKPVEVELKQSILTGGAHCEFEITH